MDTLAAHDSPPARRAASPLARVLVALEVALWAAIARAGSLLLLEDGLSALSLNGAAASVRTAAAVGLVGGLAAALAPRALRLVGALVAGALVLVAAFGWPHAEFGAGTWPLEGTAVDRQRLLVAASAGLLVALRLALVPIRAAGGFAVVAATAAAAFVLESRVDARSDALRPPIVDWRVRSSVLESPELYRVLREHSERDVTTKVFSTTSNTSLNGGPRPALVMVPPSRVRIEIPPEWAEIGARLDLAAGVDEESWKEVGRSRGLVFRARVGEETVFKKTLVRRDYDGPALDDADIAREWHETKIDLAGVEEIVLSVRTTDDTKVSSDLVCGFANLLIETPHEQRRALSSRVDPSLVFVVIDTMRADAFDPALDGHTPAMARIAGRGTRFDRGYSASSWTWPSTASLLTALTPPEHGVQDAESNFLSERWLTLGEHLLENGFSTAAWSMNPLVSANKNFDQGFQTFHETSWERASTVIDDVCAWIEDKRRERFFLFLQFTDPHGPYEPPDEVKARFGVEDPRGYSHTALETLQRKGRDRTPIEKALWPEWVEHAHRLYDLEVHDVDAALARIEATLERLGLDDRTLVVMTSDHGEEFLEHGRMGHGPQLFEETIHVPLFLAGPGVPVGRVESRVTANRFLAPTLLDLLGIARAENLDGPNVLEDEDAAPQVLLSTAIGDWRGLGRLDIFGVREGDWLYHYGVDPDGRDLRRQALFDLGDSLIAGDNEARSERGRPIAERLRARVESWIEDAERVRPSSFGADASTLDFLEQMGYAEVADDAKRGAANGDTNGDSNGGDGTDDEDG